MPKVAGLDICKGYAVATILDDIPDDVRAFWKDTLKKRSRKPKEDEFTFFFCHDVYEKVLKPGTKTVKINGDLLIRGIDTFLSWGVDAVCMEPTGLHYAHFIAKVCEKHGIKVLWVSHEVCKGWRSNHKLPDKNDLADSFALAVYGVTYHSKPSYFIRFENGNILKLRDLYHYRKFLVRLRVKCSNRSQQHLAYEFPETAALYSKPANTGDDGRCPLFVAASGRVRERSHWPKRLEQSIAREYGIDLSPPTVYLSGLTDDLDYKLTEVNEDLAAVLNASQFARYNQVFDRFHFGANLRAILLILIYPFSERFTDVSRFKRRVGLARIETQSGSSIRGEKTGSSSGLARTEWYMWVSAYIKLHFPGNASPELHKIKAFHDLKDSELKADPAKLSELLVKRYQDSLRSKMFAQLVSDLGPVEAKRVLDGVDWSAKTPSQSEKFRAVGNLVISKTAGYAAKQLYHALDAVRADLDK